ESRIDPADSSVNARRQGRAYFLEHPLDESRPSFLLTHGQRERHAMAQGRSSRTRSARYIQRRGSGGCSRVKGRTSDRDRGSGRPLTPPIPPYVRSAYTAVP